eukprot:IDg7955t1
MRKCSAVKAGLLGSDTSVPLESDMQAYFSARVRRFGMKTDSLCAVTSIILNGQTHDEALEYFAAMSPDGSLCIVKSTYDSNARLVWAAEEERRESIKRAMNQFIAKGGEVLPLTGDGRNVGVVQGIYGLRMMPYVTRRLKKTPTATGTETRRIARKL